MNIEQRITRAKRPRITLPRVPLISQIYLGGLLALVLLLIVSSVSAWFIIDQQAHASIDNIAGDTLDSFQSELSEDVNALTLFGKWFANDGTANFFANSPQNAEIAQQLQTILSMEDLDFIVITDNHGLIISKSGQTPIGNNSINISGLTEITDALAGRSNLLADVDASGQLAIKFTLPRYNLSSPNNVDAVPKPVAGTVTLGFYVDDDYLKSVKKKTSFDMGLVVISKDQLAASRLTSRGATLQMAQFSTGNSNLDDSAFNGNRLVTLMTNHGPYLYKFQPLTIPVRSSSIVIGSGIPTSVVDAEHALWLRIMGLWLVFGLIALGVGGFPLARSFTDSLKTLTMAVQQIESGNLTSRVILRRDDELGDLAVYLDNMRKKLNQKIAELNFEKNGLATAINNLAVPVVITNAQNRIAVVNHAAEHVLVTQNATLAERSWYSLFIHSNGSEPRGFSVPSSSMLDESGPMIVRERLALASKPQSVLDISSAPIHIGSELIGYIHTLQDASEADRFARSKNEFLLSVAHELQGPLASWRASVDLLIEDYFEMTRSELGTMLRTLQKTVLRFQSLVGALVDMGKLEAGKFRILPAPALFEKLVHDSLAQIDSVPRTKGQELIVRINTPANCQVMADQARIAQVIINLVRNASKYSPDGEPIIVETRQAAGQVFFQVTDKGNGISPEEQEHIFERYYRSKRVEEDGSGIGLGLALAKAIIEAHGGKIGVLSETGKGSMFWFSLSGIDPSENENELGDMNEGADRRR